MTKKEEDAFVTLLQLDTIRGPHSTGVAFIHHKDNNIIAKAKGTPWDLFGNDDFRKGMARGNAALIGHNRYATKGEINDKNAHPFEHEAIVGAHNGTLRRQSLLEDYKKFEVDSDNIFYDMNIKGYASTIKRLDGAFALAWFDANDLTVNLCRNSERPLYFVFTDDNKTVFWASEAWMLRVALSRSGLKHFDIKELGVGEHVAFDLPMCFPCQVAAYPDYFTEKLDLCPEYSYESNWHYSRGDSHTKKDEGKDASGTKAGVSNTGTGGSTQLALPIGTNFSELLAKYRKEEWIEFYVAEEVRTTKGNVQPHIKGYTQDKYEVEVRVYVEPGSPNWYKLAKSMDWFRGKVRTTNQSSDKMGHIVIDPRYISDLVWKDLSPQARDSFNKTTQNSPYKGFEGKPLSAARYVELTNCGCALCNEIASLADHKEITWVTEDDYLCKKCSKDTAFAESVIEEEKLRRLIN